VPGIGDVYTQEWEKAVNQAVTGAKEPKAALEEAAGRANQILESNKKKYG
jgi:multiple sugar transport system substrate-binding protein